MGTKGQKLGERLRGGSGKTWLREKCHAVQYREARAIRVRWVGPQYAPMTEEAIVLWVLNDPPKVIDLK